MGKEWGCEHMKPETDFLVDHHVGSVAHRVKPKFCFECGLPRPSEPKKLKNVLFNAYVNGSMGDWGFPEKAAKEWFVELVESMKVYKHDGIVRDMERIDKSELLKRIESES